MDELYLGPVPFGEDCAQVGTADYANQAKKECSAYIGQLKRRFGEPPHGARLWTKPNLHDFGTYYEVVVAFDENNEAATDYAYRVEGHSPEEWDEQARKDLGI